MNNEINKTITAYKRRLEDKQVNNAIYSIFLVITIFVYGGFGLYSFYKTIRVKYTTYTDLKQLNTNLENKLQSLSTIRKSLSDADPYVQELLKTVPLKPEVEKYVVDITSTSAGAGYKTNSLNVQMSEDTVTVFMIRNEGPSATFAQLIENIENLERMSVVTRFNMSMDDSFARNNMDVTVFQLKAE